MGSKKPILDPWQQLAKFVIVLTYCGDAVDGRDKEFLRLIPGLVGMHELFGVCRQHATVWGHCCRLLLVWMLVCKFGMELYILHLDHGTIHNS